MSLKTPYKDTTENLIKYFEHKYPLKPNSTYPRKEGEYYKTADRLRFDIRYQIENSKNAISMIVYTYVEGEDPDLQTIHVCGESFERTDFMPKL
jgi:hypothetical protein